MAPDRQEALALWRYHLIAEALSPRLGCKERGIIVRRIAGQEHVGPDGEPRSVSRNTLDRWASRWVKSASSVGANALMTTPRACRRDALQPQQEAPGWPRDTSRSSWD
jgi:hypothetical protein